MKRFIAVLTFSLLFFAGKADTIGPYEIYLRHKHVATVAFEGKTHLTLKIDSISAGDTLRISRVNCPGSERPVTYRVLIMDTTKSETMTPYQSRHTEFVPYKIPLDAIVFQYKLGGERDYVIQLYATKRENEMFMGPIILHLE